MKTGQISEFNAVNVYSTIWDHKYIILVVTLIAALVSAGIAYFVLKSEFKSTVNVVPPQQSGSGLDGAMGAISGTLKDIGLTKLGGSGGDNYSYIVILESRSVKDSIIKEFNLPKVYNIPENMYSLVMETFESKLEIDYERDGNYYVSVWDTDKNRAAEMANRYIEVANTIAIKIFKEETELNLSNMEKRLFSADSTLKAISDTLEKFSRRTMMFHPMEQAAAISKSLSDLKSEEIKYDLLYDYYSKIYGEEDFTTQSFMQMREKIKESLINAKNQSGFAGNFSLNNAAGEGIEFMRLYSELETYTKVKAFLLPMIEKNRLDESKKIKNLIVLDKAIPADRKDRPSRAMIVAGSAFGAFAMTIFIILIINSMKNFNERRKLIIIEE